MIFNPFRAKKETSLGVDIGTSSIKIVELQKKGGGIELSNYAEYSSGEGSAIHSSSVRLLSSQAADIIKQLTREAHLEVREATMSIPMFSGFSTVITMPGMSDAELAQAVQYEAKKYIPLPLSEVQFEWTKLGNSDKAVRLLIVAVTNELINKYHEIAKLSGLTLKYLELESFSMARALTNSKQGAVSGASSLIIDIGSRSSTLTVVEGAWPVFSRSMDVSGLEFSKIISSSLGIDFARAEDLKKIDGIKVGDGVLMPLIDSVLQEARRISDNYTKIRKLSIGEVILSGGSSSMPGFLNYVVKVLGRQTKIGDPFRDIIYPEQLRAVLKRMSPSFSVATGLALREFK